MRIKKRIYLYYSIVANRYHALSRQSVPRPRNASNTSPLPPRTAFNRLTVSKN